MNILVTGGTGFIGKHFVSKLIETGDNVTLLVRNINKGKKIFGNKVNYIVGDICDKNALDGCCNDIDVVYHMVAKVGNDLSNSKSYEEFFRINVDGTKNIVFEAQKAKVKKFIYVSSIAAMGIVKESPINELSKCNPILPYQLSKFDAEKFLLEEYRKSNFPVIILRPTKVYGAGEPEYSMLQQLKICKKGICLIIGKSENYISNVHINDFVEALNLAKVNGTIGEIYIVSGKNSINAKEISKIVDKKFSKRSCVVRIPKKIMGFFAYIEEHVMLFFKRKPIITYLNVMAMANDRIYDLTKAKEDLKYNPQITMENGIQEILEWYENEGVL